MNLAMPSCKEVMVLLSFQVTGLAGRGSDGFGRISGRRSSEINEIGCAVSVLAWHSVEASLERLKIEVGKKPSCYQHWRSRESPERSKWRKKHELLGKSRG